MDFINNLNPTVIRLFVIWVYVELSSGKTMKSIEFRLFNGYSDFVWKVLKIFVAEMLSEDKWSEL